MSYLVIANALAGEIIPLTVGADTYEVPCLRLDQAYVPRSGDLPLRLQFPPGMQGAAVARMAWDTFGQYTIVWRVQELMLFQPVPQGGGLDQAWPILAGYVEAAVDYWAAHRYPAGGEITQIDPRAGVYEFPNKSGQFYHGVLTTLEVSVICTV